LDFCARIKKSYEVFSKYYSKTDTSPFYAAALILHPSWHTEYIKANWPVRWYKPIMQKVTALWESFRDEAPISTLSTSFGNLDVGKEKGKEKQLDRYDQIAQDLNKYSRSTSDDEFRDYCTNEPYDIGKSTALNWWCQDQQRI
jgi:hypothetical protein